MTLTRIPRNNDKNIPRRIPINYCDISASFDQCASNDSLLKRMNVRERPQECSKTNYTWGGCKNKPSNNQLKKYTVLRLCILFCVAKGLGCSTTLAKHVGTVFWDIPPPISCYFMNLPFPPKVKHWNLRKKARHHEITQVAFSWATPWLKQSIFNEVPLNFSTNQLRWWTIPFHDLCIAQVVSSFVYTISTEFKDVRC